MSWIVFLLILAVVSIAGPIKTEIWGHAVDNSMSKGDEKSPFHTFVQRALALAEKETSKPGWFLPAESIGEKIWKVGGSWYLQHAQVGVAMEHGRSHYVSRCLTTMLQVKYYPCVQSFPVHTGPEHKEPSSALCHHPKLVAQLVWPDILPQASC